MSAVLAESELDTKPLVQHWTNGFYRAGYEAEAEGKTVARLGNVDDLDRFARML